MRCLILYFFVSTSSNMLPPLPAVLISEKEVFHNNKDNADNDSKDAVAGATADNDTTNNNDTMLPKVKPAASQILLQKNQWGQMAFALRSGVFLTKERNWPVVLSNYCS
jgi:hypothetical protein